MKKPIKPKKPSQREHPPSLNITERKLLVVDNNNNKFLLIDNDSHPEVFSDKYSLYPTWTELENLGFNWDMKTLSYSDYQKIYKECYTPSDDFTVNHIYNCDGYYDYSIVEYKTIDAKYDEKLKKFENRFIEYEAAIKNYESEIIKYNEYKKQEKITKMEKELKKLKSS